MIFVDTNVFVYAVGRPHPHKGPAREFFHDAKRTGRDLATSAEVLQELLHLYLPSGRFGALSASFELLGDTVSQIWPLEPADVNLARQLHLRYPALHARDLCHLASCRRRNVRRIKTFDRVFDATAAALT